MCVLKYAQNKFLPVKIDHLLLKHFFFTLHRVYYELHRQEEIWESGESKVKIFTKKFSLLKYTVHNLPVQYFETTMTMTGYQLCRCSISLFLAE